MGDIIRARSLISGLLGTSDWQETPAAHAIGGYRCISLYLTVSSPGSEDPVTDPSQLKIRVNWYYEEGAGAKPYPSLRRDSSQNLVLDEPLLPVGLGTYQLLVPIANPGGATGFSLSVLVNVGTPVVDIEWTAST